ncbi:MAG TPA: tRNA pseudouridine(55) synthase TruB [bacterium]
MRKRPERTPAGRRAQRTDLHGLLRLAKPPGPSSNEVLQQVRRHLGWAKAGHAGTLDPAASGLLLVLLGEAAKLVPYLAALEKEYVGVARFGAETDTQDAAGAPTRTAPWEHVDAVRVAASLASFAGASEQEPPMFSALQVGGRRLYDLAREGREVERAARTIVVSEIRLLDWRPPDAEFLVRCSSGTYVRTIARDLGALCASAAHLASLTRTGIGPFRLEGASTLEELAALPAGAAPPLVRLADAVAHLPAVALSDREAAGVFDGRAPVLPAGDVPAHVAPGGTLALLDASRRLLAVAKFIAPGVPVELLRGFREP